MTRSGLAVAIVALSAVLLVPFMLGAQKEDADASAGSAEELARLAEGAYVVHEAAYQDGRVTIDWVYEWSVRWMEGQRRLAKTPAQDRDAIEAHRKRMLKLNKQIRDLSSKGAPGGGPLPMTATEWYVAEADFLLANIK